MRGLARAPVGLLEAAVDFARWLGQLAIQRHVGTGAFERLVDLVGDDHYHAAGQLYSAARIGSVDEPEWLHELESAAGRSRRTAEIRQLHGARCTHPLHGASNGTVKIAP
jgi:hypothetical protein